MYCEFAWQSRRKYYRITFSDSISACIFISVMTRSKLPLSNFLIPSSPSVAVSIFQPNSVNACLIIFKIISGLLRGRVYTLDKKRLSCWIALSAKCRSDPHVLLTLKFAEWSRPLHDLPCNCHLLGAFQLM